MLKAVSLIMERSGKKVDALLSDVSDSKNLEFTGILHSIGLTREEINEIHQHGLKFNIICDEKLFCNCKIFNVDDGYIKFICNFKK